MTPYQGEQVQIQHAAAIGVQRDRTADEVLARRAAAADPHAWSRIFEAHWSAVYRFVRSRIDDADDAEDIASQVFEVAFARADSFDYRGLPVEAWLIGIARNLARDHVKKAARRGRTRELAEDVVAPLGDTAGAIALSQDLRRAMRTLTEEQQAVLAFRFLMDKPVAETARLMQRSEDAVKKLQRRALGAMQRVLAAEGYGRGER